MTAERRAEYIAKMPAAMRAMLDEELAAGNELNDVEVGRGADEGKFAVVMNKPFRCEWAALPDGILYRVFDGPHLESFQYHTLDEQCMLVAVKFKPMKFEKLGPQPSDSTEAFMEGVNRQNAERDALEKARAEAEKAPPPVAVEHATPDVPRLPPAERFIASMTMTFDMWHDGLGYDLAALKDVTPAELQSIERTLLSRQPPDWRDVEALAHIDSPDARAAVEAALTSRDPSVRRTAQRYAGKAPDPADRERLLIQSLNEDVIYGGLTQSIDEVPDFHPPAVIDALFRGALNRDGEIAVHFAALLMYLHGKAKEPFDWDHRPFFLRFHTENRAERKAVFAELCEKVGVDVTRYSR